jgi:RHS repeat-associated protein
VFTQFFYSPNGFKMGILNATTVQKLFVPLVAGSTAVYTGSGLVYYRHSDSLGSSRLATTSTRTLYYDGAYGPFGESYAESGTTDRSFTGMNQDTVANLYDFPARGYGIQGRWPSPDPAGFATVDPTNPQSWNRYAYVLNNPLAMVDPTGLCGDLISDPAGQDCMGQFPGSGANNGNTNDCTTACMIYVPGNPGSAGPGDVQNPGQCYEIFLDGVDTGKNTCGTGGGGQTNGSSGSNGGSSGNSGGGIWYSIVNALKNIPVPCGGGAFAYGGVRVSGGVASVSVNPGFVGIDSDSGKHSGTFTDITVGEAVQGGYGYATFKGGGAEHFLFGGVGGDVGVAKGSVTGFVSRTEGAPLTSFSRGLNLDLGLGRSGGGIGIYENFEALGTCYARKNR